MKERMPKHEHYLRGHKDDVDISELSEKLAPPEEIVAGPGKDHVSSDKDGPIDMDTGRLTLPKGFVEDNLAKRGVFGLEPVIVVILILMLVFIAFIAYLVHLMPGPVR